MAEPMKIRARLQGDKTQVIVSMSHEMETGQRKDDPSKEVIADDYRAAGDFFVFVQRHSNAPNDYTTVLTVRANDVASIEVGERIER